MSELQTHCNLANRRLLAHLFTLLVSKVLLLICIPTTNVITSCSVTMMLVLHLEVKPLMTLTTLLFLSCALISGHLFFLMIHLPTRSSLFSHTTFFRFFLKSTRLTSIHTFTPYAVFRL